MIWLNDPATTTLPQVSFYHRGSNARRSKAIKASNSLAPKYLLYPKCLIINCFYI